MTDYPPGEATDWCEDGRCGHDLCTWITAVIDAGEPEPSITCFTEDEPVLTDCLTCQGSGLVYEEPPGWWNGSRVFAREYECTDCHGTGTVITLVAA
jgi:hypothetical protein